MTIRDGTGRDGDIRKLGIIACEIKILIIEWYLQRRLVELRDMIRSGN
jgi:hypothetical protein